MAKRRDCNVEKTRLFFLKTIIIHFKIIIVFFLKDNGCKNKSVQNTIRYPLLNSLPMHNGRCLYVANLLPGSAEKYRRHTKKIVAAVGGKISNMSG